MSRGSKASCTSIALDHLSAGGERVPQGLGFAGSTRPPHGTACHTFLPGNPNPLPWVWAVWSFACLQREASPVCAPVCPGPILLRCAAGEAPSPFFFPQSRGMHHQMQWLRPPKQPPSDRAMGSGFGPLRMSRAWDQCLSSGLFIRFVARCKLFVPTHSSPTTGNGGSRFVNASGAMMEFPCYGAIPRPIVMPESHIMLCFPPSWPSHPFAGEVQAHQAKPPFFDSLVGNC